MKMILSTLCLLLAAYLPQSVMADEDTAGVMVTDSVSATVTIVKVNKKDRSLTLRDDKGKETTVTAGPEVRNFDQIKKGDLLDVKYTQAAASSLVKVDKTTSMTSGQTVQVAPKGEKPGMAAAQTETIVAQVMDVDKENRMVTLKGPRGRVVAVKVPEDLKTFDELKKGDKVSAQYVEAVAVSVRSPDKK